MSDDVNEAKKASAVIHHLPARPKAPSLRQQISDEIGLSMAKHFREQNEIVRSANANLSAQVQRLMNGIDRLLGETSGVRSGEQEEAFARVAPVGASPDLPTVSAESALIYTETSASISQKLGLFKPSQIGVMLGKRGLKWAGNGDFQEIGRHKSPSQTKFWHREVPDRMKAILDENNPVKYGITDNAVLLMFKRWGDESIRKEFLNSNVGTENPQ